jgi:hypothetical protein
LSGRPASEEADRLRGRSLALEHLEVAMKKSLFGLLLVVGAIAVVALLMRRRSESGRDEWDSFGEESFSAMREAATTAGDATEQATSEITKAAKDATSEVTKAAKDAASKAVESAKDAHA